MSKRIIKGVKGDKLTDVFVKAGICASKREAKRLIDNGCVKVVGNNAECFCDVEYVVYQNERRKGEPWLKNHLNQKL